MINKDLIKLKFDNSFNGRLFAVQGDTGRVFNLQVFDDLEVPVDVTGMSLRMYVGNSKEVSYSEGETVNAKDGKIKVQVYNSQLKYPGKQKAQFVLTDATGQKIGSKIFYLWIEEGLEAGASTGRNIYVDFEKIDETLRLIKNYDSTLEQAKEVDISLKADIKEGIEARNNLVDCKKKALEIKDQLDNSKTDATKTLNDLKTTKTESETLKNNLASENQKATENIKVLTDKIDTGNAASNELSTSIEDAKANKTNLDNSNSTALNTKKSLEDATNTANTTKEHLINLKNQGDTLSADLSSKIISGSNLKTNLEVSINNAANAKDTLDSSVRTGTSTNTSLKATNEDAKKTENLIRDLINSLSKTEEEVKQIIASGDLSQYITDPKLQEALKDYATKDDLSKIDVTAQLVDYAKKTAIPTKLSQLTNDKTFKTETEIIQLINNSKKLKKEVVSSLPSAGQEDTIYLLKNKGDANNFYTEYLWINGSWEIIGDTKVDLTDYAKKTDIKTKLSEMTGDSSNRTVSDTEKTNWDNKVDKINGKSLSTNDYTNAEKKKVQNIPANPQYTDTVTTINGKTGTITKQDLEALGLGGINEDKAREIAAEIAYADYLFTSDNLYLELNKNFKTNFSSSVKTVYNIVYSKAAITELINNPYAFRAALKCVKFNEMAAKSSTAMTEIANNSMAFEATLSNLMAIKIFFNNPTSMQAIANSSIAMNKIAGNSMLITEIINSSTSLSSIANSSTALKILGSSSSATEMLLNSNLTKITNTRVTSDGKMILLGVTPAIFGAVLKAASPNYIREVNSQGSFSSASTKYGNVRPCLEYAPYGYTMLEPANSFSLIYIPTN